MSSFVYRGPIVPYSSMFFGREKELNRLLRLCTGDVNAYAIVYGARQEGKTSLLLKLKSILPSDTNCCIVDFQALPDGEFLPVLDYLAFRVTESLQLDEPEKKINSAIEFVHYIDQAIKRSNISKLVLILEEFGALPLNTRQDVANVLRAMFTNRYGNSLSSLSKLMIVLSGGIELWSLSTGFASPLANICEPIYLTDLDEEQTISLIINGLDHLISIEEAQLIGLYVYSQTRGHPYLTQRLGALIEDGLSQGIPLTQILKKEYSNQLLLDDPFIQHLLRSVKSPELWRATNHLLQEKPKFSRLNEEMWRLELVGIAKEDAGYWKVRNPIIERAIVTLNSDLVIWELKNQVRDWFEDTGYGLEKQISIQKDKHLDLYKSRIGPVETRILAAYFESEITIDDLKQLEIYLETYDDAKGIAISSSQVSPSAQQYAIAHRNKLSAYTLNEFIKGLDVFNIREYSDYLNSRINSAGIDSTYVSLSAGKPQYDMAGTEIGVDIYPRVEDYIHTWVKEDGKNSLAILGDAGSGKTWLCIYYASLQLKRFLGDPANERLPILISVRELYAPSSKIEQMITDWTKKIGLFLSDGWTLFNRLNQAGRLIIIIDGLDEMPKAVGPQTPSLFEWQELLTPKTKLIITSRTTFFHDEREVQEVVGEFQRNIQEKSKVELIYLRSLDHNQFIQMVRAQYSESTAELVLHQLNSSLASLGVLSKSPVFLHILSKVIRAIPDEDVIVYPAKLYDLYVDTLISRDLQEQRIGINKDELLLSLEDVSYQMFLDDTYTINFRKLKHSTAKKEKLFYDSIRVIPFLQRDSKGNYSFIHISFRDYFLARRIRRSLHNTDTEMFIETLNKFPLAQGVISFLLGTQPVNLSTHLEWLRYETLEETGVLGTNIITLLVSFGEDLSSYDLKNIPTSTSQDFLFMLRSSQILYQNKANIEGILVNTGDLSLDNVSFRICDAMGYSLRNWKREFLVDHILPGTSEGFQFSIQPNSEHTMLNFQLKYSVSGIYKETDIEKDAWFFPQKKAFSKVANPYIVGPAIQPESGSPFVGRLDIVEWVEQYLSGKAKVILILHGQRRTGKTSALLQIAYGSLGDQLRDRLKYPIYPVYIDLQGLAGYDTSDFLISMCNSISKAIKGKGLNCPLPDNASFYATPFPAFNSFFDAIEYTIGSGIAFIMIDEFEELEEYVKANQIDAAIFKQLRHQMQHRKQIYFLLTGTRRIEEMSQNYKSSIFNLARHHEITFLTKPDATDLIRNPVSPTVHYNEDAVELLWDYTRGHPYFLQLLCQDIINDLNSRGISYDVTKQDAERCIEMLLRNPGQELVYLWDQASNIEKILLPIIASNSGPNQLVSFSQIKHQALSFSLSNDDVNDNLQRLVDRRILNRLAPDDLENHSETAYSYCFDLLRKWVLIQHPLDTL